MLGGADNPNGELPSYITGADKSVGCVNSKLFFGFLLCWYKRSCIDSFDYSFL